MRYQYFKFGVVLLTTDRETLIYLLKSIKVKVKGTKIWKKNKEKEEYAALWKKQREKEKRVKS